MEVTPAAALPFSAPLSEIQPSQSAPIVERQLFDYLVEIEKGIGSAGQITDPSTLVDGALQSLEGVTQAAQKAFSDANTSLALPGSDTGAQDASARMSASDDGSVPADKDAGTAPEESAAQILDRAVSVMWAAANVSLAVNSMTAATSSANSLIKQP